MARKKFVTDRSVVSEGGDRIDRRRPPSGQPAGAGGQRAAAPQGTPTKTTGSMRPPCTTWIATMNATHQPADGARADRRACSRRRSAARPPRRRAEREPHADLGRAARDGVAHDGVDADRRQHEQQRTEHHEHPRGDPAQKQVLLDVIGHACGRRTPAASDRDARTARSISGASSASAPARGANVNLARGRRSIAIRKIDDRQRRLAERIVERCPHDADDRVARAARFEATADRLEPGKVAPHELLVDDRLRRRVRSSSAAKSRPFSQRNAHRPEIIRRHGVRERLIGRGRRCARGPRA